MGTLWAPRRLPLLFPRPLEEGQGEGTMPAGVHHGRHGGTEQMNGECGMRNTEWLLLTLDS
jgi:hypothetical protein